MMRSGRHTTILDIISKREIETQEELCAELNKQNYKVTQATVSRDIKELRLFKVAGVEKKYKYAYIDEGTFHASRNESGRYQNAARQRQQCGHDRG